MQHVKYAKNVIAHFHDIYEGMLPETQFGFRKSGLTVNAQLTLGVDAVILLVSLSKTPGHLSPQNPSHLSVKHASYQSSYCV